MRLALARHQTIVATSIQQQRGIIVKSQGEGDSLFADFSRATDAVAAACVLQQALTAEHWPAGTPLRVRAALHTGETELRDGDYYGSAVNRCARLRAAEAETGDQAFGQCQDTARVGSAARNGYSQTHGVHRGGTPGS